MLKNNLPIFLITDRGITLSDSVSRYVIDLAEGFSRLDKEVVIYTTKENKMDDYKLPKSIKVVKGLPKVSKKAIFHFQLTYSIRKHTEFFLGNAAELKDNCVVTLHVSPEYALAMGQAAEMGSILGAISKYSILVHSFSNYSKYDLKKYGVNRVWVVYPGLNLSRYSKFVRLARNKKRQILVVASNPDSNFIKEAKGFDFISAVEKKFKDFLVKRVVNLPFGEYLSEMAVSQFYVALSKVEHYGFAIIDAYNLFTIPIYSNEGGLTEAVYGNGIPILANTKKVVIPAKLGYNDSVCMDNFAFSSAEHTIEKHLINLERIYSIL